MHKILFVVQDCRLEIAIFWQENRAVEGKCNGLWEISMLKRMEESQCPLRTSWSLNSKEEQSDPKKGSEPHRNDRFSWKRTDVHEGAEWEGWEKDDKEKKHFLPLGPATGTIKTRGWGGGLLWNSCPGLLQPIDGVGLQCWNDGSQGRKILQDPTFLQKEWLEI